MSLFQLFVSIFRHKTFFSNDKKGASWVALFYQEKIGFLASRISTAIWGLFPVFSIQFPVFSLLVLENLQSKIANQKSVIKIFSFLLITTLFLFSNGSFSQETQSTKSGVPPSGARGLKIGLVLSGGGAKGFAHIGALKVLEQAGIKIDYIGGTSMGAVVGGLYATGYNAEQIDSIFQKTNFDELINDFIPRSSKNFYEKRNNEMYAFVLPFNNFKLGVPEALSKGLYNFNLLSRLTRNVRNIKDFNQLPIPFLCMGTNIETGDEVVLNKGNLAQAMIASSAFPSLFAPVEIDGKLLVDGGVANNYPVDAVRQMGADIIIGVDVQAGLMDRKDLKDATKILVQINNLNTIKKIEQNILKTDIYIKPNIKDFTIISFEKGKEIIQKGEEAALLVYDKIQKVASQSSFYKKPPLQLKTDSLHIATIDYTPLKNYTTGYMLGKLRFKPDSKITYTDLIKGINNINATQNFSNIMYSLDNNTRSPTENLKINLKENSTKTYLKLGLHYDGLFKSGVLVNLTRKKSIIRNDIASLDVILGDNFRYNLDYYIDNGFNLSFGFKSQFNQFNRNITNEISSLNLASFGLNTINVNFSEQVNQAYFQSIFVQKFLIGGGVELKFLDINSKTLANINPVIDKSNYGSLFGYLKYDSFDNKYFPKSGWSFSGDLQSYLLSSNYTQEFHPFNIAKADFGIAATVFKKFSLNLHTDAGMSFGNDSVAFFNFVFGGYGYPNLENFKPFYGYDFLSVSANSYIKTYGSIDYEFMKKNHLNFSANFANLGNRIFETVDWISVPKHSGYALGYSLETILGPVEIKQSWSPEAKKNYTWFSVGFTF
jgi:NTE family protein